MSAREYALLDAARIVVAALSALFAVRSWQYGALVARRWRSTRDREYQARVLLCGALVLAALASGLTCLERLGQPLRWQLPLFFAMDLLGLAGVSKLLGRRRP